MGNRTGDTAHRCAWTVRIKQDHRAWVQGTELIVATRTPGRHEMVEGSGGSGRLRRAPRSFSAVLHVFLAPRAVPNGRTFARANSLLSSFTVGARSSAEASSSLREIVVGHWGRSAGGRVAPLPLWTLLLDGRVSAAIGACSAWTTSLVDVLGAGPRPHAAMWACPKGAPTHPFGRVAVDDAGSEPIVACKIRSRPSRDQSMDVIAHPALKSANDCIM